MTQTFELTFVHDSGELDSYAHRAGWALMHKNLARLNLIRAHDLQLSVNLSFWRLFSPDVF